MTRRDGRGRRSERGGEVRGKDDCRRGCRFPGCVLCDLGSGRVLVCRPESAGGVFRWVGGRSQRGLDWGGAAFVFAGGFEEWIEGKGGKLALPFFLLKGRCEEQGKASTMPGGRHPLSPPPSSSSPESHSPSPSSPQLRLSALSTQKAQIESELALNLGILSSHNADMNTPLLDSGGFPRADIDIVTVRTTRVKIIRLRNDLKQVIDQLAVELANFHSSNAKEINNNNRDRTEQQQQQRHQQQQEPQLRLQPFARVDGVAPGSPADSAGLRREDLLLSFGIITSSSLSPDTNLAPLAALAAEYEDRTLTVKVLRRRASPANSDLHSTSNSDAPSESDPVSGQVSGSGSLLGSDSESSSPTQQQSALTLTLTPRKGWGGRGLLGCHIVPYSPSS
ncbi:26S proteasome non-ATPase regulatory subunit 9 [Pyrrhoderma noxium]|uniref:26S proteasome non-ATPase regulatory subunit 9 n=1 Tax=Pyrrhoderma noxium TaxID=2282107 RepID=A0A286UBR7_9AGAM|nr:26S proteasome non-ATPase regulatory subunit 9 [Pyrrhoderma noxium]